MRKIYLVGFMGCGKSAIGRRLSYFLKMPYYDMDHEIVRQQGMTIPEIFEKYGEDRFREIETEFLENFRNEACIIATGGGVAMKEENRRIMRRTGLVFFLDATFDDIYMRIAMIKIVQLYSVLQKKKCMNYIKKEESFTEKLVIFKY